MLASTKKQSNHRLSQRPISRAQEVKDQNAVYVGIQGQLQQVSVRSQNERAEVKVLSIIKRDCDRGEEIDTYI